MTTLDPRHSLHTLREDLRRWLVDRGRPAFVGTHVTVVARTTELHADVAVALDASSRPRRRWIDVLEGRAVDVVFLIVDGERLATLTTAARHVEQGVGEAFVFDPIAHAVWGFRRNELRVDAIPVNSAGALRSRLLGAEVMARGGRVRLAPVATSELHEVLDRIDRALDRIERERARAAS